MSDIEITVQGTFTAYAPPERATVRLRVAHEGPEPSAVLDSATRTAGRVRESIEALHDKSAGPVTWWSSQHLQTSAHRPCHQEGKQLPLVHSARMARKTIHLPVGAVAEVITGPSPRRRRCG